MAEKIDKVFHKRSNQIVDGAPKLPTPEQLEYGEIAINYASDNETISLKNSNNEIATFSNDKILNRKIDAKADKTAISDMLTKTAASSTYAPKSHTHEVSQISNLGSGWDNVLTKYLDPGWANYLGSSISSLSSSHTHEVSQISNLGSGWDNVLTKDLGTNWDTALASKLGVNWNTLLGTTVNEGWIDILHNTTYNAPFAPTLHTHEVSQISNLGSGWESVLRYAPSRTSIGTNIGEISWGQLESAEDTFKEYTEVGVYNFTIPLYYGIGELVVKYTDSVIIQHLCFYRKDISTTRPTEDSSGHEVYATRYKLGTVWSQWSSCRISTTNNNESSLWHIK